MKPTTSQEIAIKYQNPLTPKGDLEFSEKLWLPADEVLTKYEVEKVIDDIYDNDTWNGKILKKYLKQKWGLK